MNETLIAGLLASARHFQTAGEALTSAGDSLKALALALEAEEHEDGSEPSGDNPYKKPNGRMSRAGAEAIEAAYAAGATITEVSKRFGIHTSAANYRHKEWLKTQKKSA